MPGEDGDKVGLGQAIGKAAVAENHGGVLDGPQYSGPSPKATREQPLGSLRDGGRKTANQ